MIAGLMLLSFFLSIICGLTAIAMALYLVANWMWGKGQEGYVWILTTLVISTYLLPSDFVQGQITNSNIAGALIWALLIVWYIYKRNILNANNK